MDPAQILLLIVVTVLTFLLLLLGLQVYFILRELRKTIIKMNKVLDDAGIISQSVAQPVSNLSGIITGVKTGLSILSIFSNKKKQKEQEKGE